MVYGVLVLVCCALCLLMRVPALRHFRCAGLIAMLVMTAMISALRSSSVGTDGPMYERLIRRPNTCLHYGFEAGYCLLNHAMHWLGSYTVLLVLESVLLYAAIGLFIYRYIDEQWWGFSCLMVFGTRTFFMAMNISRQYIAVALCVFAFMLYERRHWKLALGLVLLAMTFHITSIVVLLVPVVEWWQCHAKRFEVQSTVAVAVAFAMQFLDYGGIINWVAGFVPKYRHYQHDSLMEYTGTSVVWVLYTLAVSAVFIVYVWRERKSDDQFGHEKEMVQLDDGSPLLAGALICVVMTDIFAGVDTLSRMSVFFVMFFIWLLTALLATLGKRSQIAVEILVLVVSFLTCYRQVYARGNFGVLPYKMFFE